MKAVFNLQTHKLSMMQILALVLLWVFFLWIRGGDVFMKTTPCVVAAWGSFHWSLISKRTRVVTGADVLRGAERTRRSLQLLAGCCLCCWGSKT